jgi:Spy/CpxP family protein refolding chaperone
MGLEAPWISLSLRHRADLNLTAEQVSTLEQLRADFAERAKPVHSELRDVEKEIMGLLQVNPVDLAQAKAKIEQAERLRSELRYLRVETLDKGKAVLTTEQNDQLKNLLSSMQRRFRKPQGQAS